MNFQQQQYEAVMDPGMPNHHLQAPMEAIDGGSLEQDESPILACLRGNKNGRNGGLNSGSNHSIPFVKPEFAPDYPEDDGLPNFHEPDFHDLANQHNYDDDLSINPLDAFEIDNVLISGDDANLVDLALRSPHESVATSFHDSASGGSLGVSALYGDDEVEEEELKRNEQLKEQMRKETLESLNASMSSLNDAFERLTASMDRTAKSRDMLRQFEEQNPAEAIRKDVASTGIVQTPAIIAATASSRRARRGMVRSGSNNSINSLGSRGSIGSRGRKNRARKLKRNVKSDLRSDLRNELSRSRSNSNRSLGNRSLGRSNSNRSLGLLPDHIVVTGI